MARRIRDRRDGDADRVDGGAGLELAIDALAVYRLVRLAQRDEITTSLRVWFVTRHGGKGKHMSWSALADCPWCLGMWVAGGTVVARTVAPRLWGKIARALAFSAGAGVITGLVDQLEQADRRE